MSPPTVKIYVGNIPSSARNSELKELFEKFGKVVECDILKDYGFVHMSDTNDAKAAIAGLNDTLWKGARVRVELSTTKTSKGKPAQRNNMKNNNGPNDRYNNNNMNGGGRNSYPMHRGGGGSRPAPYPRDNFHHHPYGGMNNGGPDMGPRGRNGGGGGGPMRGSENRYNGGGRYMQGQMPDRPGGRPQPYPDQFDRNGRGPMPSQNGMSNGNGMNGSQRNDYSYRNGSDSRDHRNGGGFSNGGSMDHPPYMGRNGPPMPPPHQLPPPGSMPPHMHDDYYRGAPPMGPPSRYDNFDHYGPPPQSSGSRSGGSGRYNNYK